MAINKKFIHFKRKSTFQRELEAGNILNTSIVFIADAKQIYLNGSYFSENTLFNLSDLLNEVSGDLTSTDTSNEAIVKLYKQLQEVDTNTNDLIKILMQEVSTLEGTLTNRIDNTDLTLATELSRIDQEIGNLENLVNITYSELKSLRDSSKLIPGRWYRITDYECTTSTNGTSSAGHQFDIVVLALSNNSLSEEARAIQHEGDTYFANCNLAGWKIWYCLDNDNTKYTWADTANGKGVIYHMIDEWQNDCPYDFKNIMFNRTVTAGGLNINGVYYTFSWVNEANEVEDASIVGQTLTNDEGTVNGVHDNLISASDAYNLGINNNTMALALNGNVFVSEYSFGNGFFYGIYGNHLATNCYNNTFGNNCYGNSFGNGCYDNSFGNNCDGNSFGNDCGSNSFGNNCLGNSFGNDYYSNSFGYSCYDNSFGNSCNGNSFGNNCYGNSFGNSCYRNSFGDYCNNNSFGNDCLDNTFGNYCISNSFGNDCNGNSFGNSCYRNSFGNDCGSNSFENSCSSNSFRNNCESNTFKNDCNNNTFGNKCTKNIFGIGCQYNLFGNNCYQNTFGNNCSGITFENYCYSNSFGNGCSSNSFENNCCSNSFGYFCAHNSFGVNCYQNTFGNNCDRNSFGVNCYQNTFGNHFRYNTLDNDVQYIKISTEKIYHTHILNGTKGTDNNKLTIAFTPETKYSQFAGFTSSEQIKVWNPADLNVIAE